MAYQNIGTVTVVGVFSLTVSTAPPFITSGYSSTFYHYKFVVDVKNDTLNDYTGLYLVFSAGASGTQITTSSFDLDAGESTSITIYYPMKYVGGTSQQYLFMVLYDSSDNSLIGSTPSIEIRSVPTLTTHSLSLNKSSYVIGDTLSASITVQRGSGNDVVVLSNSVLYDVDFNKVTDNSISAFYLTDTNSVSKDYSDYTLVANSYTLGTWTWYNSISVGWKGDDVYYQSAGNWVLFEDRLTNFYNEQPTITVSATPTPEFKLGTNHVLPSSVTKGTASTFSIEVVNTYSSSKTFYLKLQFGYPSNPGNGYTYTYVVTSPNLTAKASTTTTYDVSVTIPTSYEGTGSNDVNAELHEVTS